VALTIAFAICWSPFTIVRALIYFHLTDEGYVWRFSQILILSNTVLDPILYGIYGGKLKPFLKRLLPERPQTKTRVARVTPQKNDETNKNSQGYHVTWARDMKSQLTTSELPVAFMVKQVHWYENVPKIRLKWKVLHKDSFWNREAQDNSEMAYSFASKIWTTFPKIALCCRIFFPRGIHLRWLLSSALRIPTAHGFHVISARTWAHAPTGHRRFPSN